MNLPGGHNHAEYIDQTGQYDITQYLEHHKHKFPAIYIVCLGQICPHISTEVDCESLFSTAGYLADPRRSLTNIRLYERLVIAKHRLGRIYCHVPAVKELYLKRWKEKDWDENDKRDTKEFLELEKEIHLGLYPHNKYLFQDEDEEEEEDNEEDDKVDDAEAESDKATKRKRIAGSKKASTKKVIQIDSANDDDDADDGGMLA